MTIFSFCFLQPDHGGSKVCYALTGISPEKYGAFFHPNITFPTLSYSRFCYKLTPLKFDEMKKEITLKYKCNWSKGTEWRYASFPGMDQIDDDTGYFTYYKVSDVDRYVWLHYNREKEELCLGVYNY